MTTTTAPATPPTLRATRGPRVELWGCGAALTPAVLAGALAVTPARVVWRVGAADGAEPVSRVAVADVVVCPAAWTAGAVRGHPGSLVVALVTGSDAADSVHVALRDGAATCVPGVEPRLVAAFVYAVLRRRGVVDGP